MEHSVFQQIQIQGQSKHSGQLFPKCYAPVGYQNFISLQEYFQQHAKQVISELNREGALYFRGFDIKSPEQFSAILTKLGLESFQYVGGAAVRKLIVGTQGKKTKSVQIFTTNEAPPQEPIPFHNQLLQNQNYPDYVSFYCYSEADKGGNTPLVSSLQLYKYIQSKHPDFLNKLQQLGVRYMRIVSKQDNPKSPIGRGWSNVFKANEKIQAEQKMKKNGYQCQWLNDEDCKLISKKLPAITKSKCGKKVFCNQMIAVFNGWIDEKNSPAECLKFGDFSALPSQIMKDISEFADKIKASIDWKVGDFVLIDNQMVKHARQPFQGTTRKIYASLLKGQKQIEKGIHYTLHSGDLLPLIGLGTWKISKNDAQQVVYQAIKAGYRLIDCAACYGNQVEVGKGINKAIKQEIVSRSQMFVTSKLWNTFHDPKNVRSAFERTRKDLNLQYLDLYLIHWPVSCQYIDPSVAYPTSFTIQPTPKEGPTVVLEQIPIIDTWRALQQLHSQGLIRNIGVSNFNVSILRDLIYSSKIKPAVNQIQLHAQLSQKKFVRFCRQNGISVTSYSSLGGLGYIQINMASNEQLITENEQLRQIAIKYSKTIPQILLRWVIQQGLAIIPKTSKRQRLIQNKSASQWRLQDEDMKMIDSLNKNKRYCDPGQFGKDFNGPVCMTFD